MKRVEFKGWVTVPDIDVTNKEIKEWIYFELGFCNHISKTNNLSGYDIECNNVKEINIIGM